jgi:hypothetical protein
MANNPGLIPSITTPVSSANGLVTNPWYFFLKGLGQGGNNTGNFVVNGSASSVATLTLFEGLDSDRGVGVTGDIYFATDTGKIYVNIGGLWRAELPAYTGDVTSTVGGTVLTLNDVNPVSVGTFTNATITVNEKGLITLASSGISSGMPAGLSGDVQYNFSGAFAADTGNFDYTHGIGLKISALGGLNLDSANQSAPGPGFVGPALIWGNGIGRPNIYGYNNGASSVIGFQLNGQSFASLTVLVNGVAVPGNLSLGGELIDSTSSPGTSGQVLTSTGTATQWETPTGGYPADNVISVPTTLPINTSYILIEFLQIDAPLVVDGMLRILL